MKHQNITYCLISSLLLAAGASLQANGKSFFPIYDEANSGAWQGIDYDGDPWVFNVSRPYFVTAGLQNRHLSLWASHGRYYYADRDVWKWQRPNLFCTNEDLFTQTIVVPYLIPMLQNAGAIVFTPRERDWQRNEIVIDNDDAVKSVYYFEKEASKRWKKCDSLGFANRYRLKDGENPFRMGTVRQAKATKRKKTSQVSYQPRFKEAGKYAVYVSYQSLPKSVSDARYIVYHKGEATEFSVNQRMGGGTWVYLGTFDFDKGCNEFNRVVCTNKASRRGVVTTDAVRFGGGMGNIERGGYTSGLPRCLEGARYYAQWAGAPYKVYGGRKGENDYADDINTRSLMTNWLGGGSVYMPAKNGKHVPIELSLALHSDAGYNKDGKSTVGALAICTTDYNDGILNSGISRFTSKDFARALRDNLVTDLTAQFGEFGKRYLWDRNYSETRLPEVPSAILEMLSHQNFPDMRIAQDPLGKFYIARSIYKTILRFVNSNHGTRYVVQPLAPQNFSVTQNQGVALLSWTAQLDKTEPSARPTSYIIYKAEGQGGFDNGTIVNTTRCQMQLEPGKLYHFKVAAVNAGGESFTTETLSVLYNPAASKSVLIVNNFHRLASPQVVDDEEKQGFDLNQDPGVSYGLTAGWSGKQQVFDRSRMGNETSFGLGFSGNEMIGKFVAGNDFNYVQAHATSIAASGKYNISSCSSEVITTSGRVQMKNYQAVDLINGLERHDGYTHAFFKSFTPALQNSIRQYASQGGRILISGSYTGSDMQTEEEQAFLSDILKLSYEPTGSTAITRDINPEDSTVTERDSIVYTSPNVKGLGLQFSYYNELNAQHYAATHPEILKPVGNYAFTAMQYDTGTSAAVAYKSTTYRSFVMGFPLECIIDERTRTSVLLGILKFLTD